MRPRAAASVLFALFALLASPGAARGDALAVRATPPRLVLGAGARAVLEIETAGGEEAPIVRASAGRVENLRPLGDGRFAADYVPPAEAYPRVAVVGVVAGGRCGFAAIPLVGRGIAVARSAPRSPIRVTIGDAVFGPVVADARGEAHVPVVVPPGVRVAYHRGKPLDLRIPPTPHVALLLAREDAPADAAQEVPVFVHAVSDDGASRAGAPVQLAATAGTVGGLAEIAPGTFTAIWRLPPGSAAPATVTARLADDAAPAASATLARSAGTPAHVSVEIARARYTAGEPEPLAVRVRVADAAGNPVADAPRLEATSGTLTPLTAAGPGAWDAALAIATALGNARRAEVVARAGAAEGRASVELAPADPARIALLPPGATLVASGRAEARVRVRVLDRFGNDVAVASPAVAATGGATVAAEPDPAGGWTVRYRPARVRARGEETLSVRAGALAGTARFELLAPERHLSVGATAGLAASRGGLRSTLLGAGAVWWTPLFSSRLGAALDVSTFVHDRTDTALVGDVALSVHGRARYVPVVASLRWRERLGRDLVAWGAAGAGLAHVSASVSTSATDAREASGFAGVVQASAALGRRFGNGVPFAELRTTWCADPRLDALRGSVAVLALSIGYVHDAY